MSDTKSGYKNVNGLNMYYEIHGRGEPLVLLHGQFTTTGMFDPILPELADRRQVVLIEQQGHGHTADIDRPLSFAQMSRDTAELLNQLQIAEADVFGYSAGGTVALQLAKSNPRLIRKLALASTVYSMDGYYPSIVEGLKHASAEAFPSQMKHEYERVAPHPENWSKLIAKGAEMANNVNKQDFLEPEQLQSITVPVLLVIGDNDIIRPDYAREMAKLLHTKLVVVTGDHASYISTQPQSLLGHLNKFFELSVNQ
ncbi:alpha/beta fold hydrolase [Paenibacillus mendelii]|uniref:Alpha/beta fold hydrolase n=1 Tax=Paenibacillus mendelii TaxID=206163 RepID=A0ABV6JDJ3_9BACL|nr:alpha/beta hydrolase [Paenibacillus mendelii]MCQ6563518.1 alpha/beta hydrolase [Paenibacillus mendelii]